MPTIPNFPPALLEEHRRWHHENHQADPNNLPPGYGERFLQFHRNYIGRALQWYNQMGYDPRLVAPWQEVPAAIRNSPCYNQAAEMRIRFNPQSFASADELGALIEGSNLHGCMHLEAARIYGESDMNDFDLAPRNTIFYNIHTMIDGWYQQWERAKGLRGTGKADRSKRTVIRGIDGSRSRIQVKPAASKKTASPKWKK
ncbi:tyrosinase family protein [Paenibacillus mendelii]|uniref:Tyrosinase family protein n=1 Tax=Paenibacillus mendelii TaxID=206163 RepID=A0ABV6JDE8_9BACL|nr:tyrosinase family protein [Paenibacillus mendelii]MCQ6562479.1 tyrosinase family protein [Paenibacillus mendelii]